MIKKATKATKATGLSSRSGKKIFTRGSCLHCRFCSSGVVL